MTDSAKRMYIALSISALFVTCNIIVVTQSTATIYSRLLDRFIGYFLPLL